MEPLEDAEPIWNFLAQRLDRDTFYAASYFLSKCHRSQHVREAEERQPSSDSIPTDNMRKDALENLALLFARFKPLNGDDVNDDEIERTHSTPQHVTACAMELRDKTSDKTIIIWIAKNDGPQTVDGLTDEGMRAKLEKWFNSTAYEPLETPNTEQGGIEHRLVTEKGTNEDCAIEQIMRAFWHRRLKYYDQQIEKDWKKLNGCGYPAEMILSRYYTSRNPDVISPKVFGKHWALIHGFVVTFDKSTTRDPIKLSAVDYHGYRVPFQPGSDLGTTDSDKTAKAVQIFHKIAKHARLILRISRMLEAFKRLRDQVREDGQSVKIQFVDHYGTFRLEPAPLVSKMEAWEDFLSHRFPDNAQNGAQTEQPNKDLQDVKRCLKDLRKMAAEERTMQLFFHCELQLLEQLSGPGERSMYDFFGCSKRSCYFCWEILRQHQFRTNSTHAHLYHLCAFPFTARESQRRLEVVSIFQRFYNHIMALVPWAPEFEAQPSPVVRHSETHPWSTDDELRERNAFLEDPIALQQQGLAGWLRNVAHRVTLLPSSKPSQKQRFNRFPLDEDEIRSVMVVRIPQDGALGGEDPQLHPHLYQMEFANVWRWRNLWPHRPIVYQRKHALRLLSLEQVDHDQAKQGKPVWDYIPLRGHANDYFILCRQDKADGSRMPLNRWTIDHRQYRNPRLPRQTKRRYPIKEQEGKLWPWRGDVFLLRLSRDGQRQQDMDDHHLPRAVQAFSARFLSSVQSGRILEGRNEIINKHFDQVRQGSDDVLLLSYTG